MASGSSAACVPVFPSKLAVEVYPEEQGGGHSYDPDAVAGVEHMTDVQRAQALAIIDDVIRVERKRLPIRRNRRFVRSQVTIRNHKPNILLHVSLVLRPVDPTEICFGCARHPTRCECC